MLGLGPNLKSPETQKTCDEIIAGLLTSGAGGIRTPGTV